jgi:nucleoside-diphosphate-sugar epimerase
MPNRSGGDPVIVVTGATGFIGSNIVAELNAVGRSDIILVGDLGTGSKWKNIAKRRFPDIVLPENSTRWKTDVADYVARYLTQADIYR